MKHKRGAQFMKIRLFVLATLVLLTGLNIASAQTRKGSARIRSVDFRNRSYPFNLGGDEELVKLRNGEDKREDGGEIYSAGKNDVVYGDVNGDGVEDAVVRIRLWTGASLRDFEIQAYEFKDGAAKLLARLPMSQVAGDYKNSMCCTGEGLRIKNGHVILEVLTDGKIILSAEKVTTFDYVLSDGKFVLSGAPKSRKIRG
jgi:hypothetical protein